MRKNLTTVILMTAIMASACDLREIHTPDTGNGEKIVRASLAGYDGSGQALEGESAVSDLHACIFQDGRMTAVFENISSSGSVYEIKVGDYGGNMYVMANTGGQIDLGSLMESGVTEQEWLRKTMTMERGGPVHFFTGSVDLGAVRQPEVPVSLKRGVARFDLRVRTAGDASVSGMTFRNVAQSAYLFPVDGEYSPAGVERNVAEVTFDEPLTTDTPAVMYVYEQAGGNVQIEADVVIDGKPVTLSREISGDLVRNTIYTVTVRKDDIDVTLDITLEDWTEGGDIEL